MPDARPLINSGHPWRGSIYAQMFDAFPMKKAPGLRDDAAEDAQNIKKHVF